MKSILDFFENNNLSLFNFDYFDKIEGDFEQLKDRFKYEVLQPKRDVQCDAHNNVIFSKFPNKNSWEYTYNSQNNIVLRRSPSGNILEWKYKYDSQNNYISCEYPNGEIYEWEYKYDSQKKCNLEEISKRYYL